MIYCFNCKKDLTKSTIIEISIHLRTCIKNKKEKNNNETNAKRVFDRSNMGINLGNN